jgi:hypothetical protein
MTVQFGDAIDLGHQDVGVETRILGAVDQVTEEGLDVGGVRRTGDDESRVGIGRGADAGRVADGAVVGDARKADGLLRETDRQFLPQLPTARRVAA